MQKTIFSEFFQHLYFPSKFPRRDLCVVEGFVHTETGRPIWNCVFTVEYFQRKAEVRQSWDRRGLHPGGRGSAFNKSRVADPNMPQVPRTQKGGRNMATTSLGSSPEPTDWCLIFFSLRLSFWRLLLLLLHTDVPFRLSFQKHLLRNVGL